jgi:hypothetical protein
MQLLSASALVPVGVGAVIIGVLILVVLAVRRRTQAPAARGSGTRAERHVVATPPPHPAVAETPAPAAGPAPAARPTPPVCDAVGNTLEVPVPAEAPAPPTPPAEAFPAAPPVVAAPVAAAEHAAAEHVAPAHASAPAASAPQYAGSGRTVAAAVAQAFAVRAAAGRAGGPPPNNPGRWPDDEARAAHSAPDAAPAPSVDDTPPREPADAAVDADSATPPSGEALPGVAAFVPMRPAVDEHGWSPVGTNGDAPPAEAAPVPTQAEGTGGGWSPPESPADAGSPRPEPGGDGVWSPPGGPADVGSVPVQPVMAAGPLVPRQPTVDDEVVPPPRSEQDGSGPAAGSRPAAVDARDRLLGVLLDDPERAVGAAVELEDCLRELDRLTDAVRHEREVLRSVLHRLADAGLRPAQLARLAGMPLPEVEELLAPAPAQQRA